MSETIVNINLSSGDAVRNETDFTYFFDLSETVQLKGNTCYVEISDFQGMNSIHNITKKNNNLILKDKEGLEYSTSLREGFYNTTDIFETLKTFFKNKPQDFKIIFDRKTLKYIISCNFIFELSGTFSDFLNMKEVVIIGDQTVPTYAISSNSVVDVFKNIQNLHIIFVDMKTGNVTTNNNTIYMGNRMAKIPVRCSFGQYIIFENNAKKSNEIYDRVIDSFTVRILNDTDEDVLTDIFWTMSVKLTIIENQEIKQTELDNQLVYKENTATNRSYPIVNNHVSILKSSRDLYEERFIIFKKAFLYNDFYSFTEKELNRMFIKKIKLKNQLDKFYL